MLNSIQVKSASSSKITLQIGMLNNPIPMVKVQLMQPCKGNGPGHCLSLEEREGHVTQEVAVTLVHHELRHIDDTDPARMLSCLAGVLQLKWKCKHLRNQFLIH
ncbi:hypothetical protein ACLKA7_007460 [Drosophila subpalustris]